MQNSSQSARRILIFCGLTVVSLLQSSCASNKPSQHHIPPLLNHASIEVDDVDFMHLSELMEAFLNQHVPPGGSRDERAWNLAWSVTDSNVLGFNYEPTLTQSPNMTFASRTGNCLAFSIMLVAMARHRGLQAWYQEVEIPPQWSSFNNTMMFSMHVNVVVEGRQDEWVVDISGRGEAPTRRNKRIPDSTAHAQYFNNLGAEALMEGKLGVAYANIRKAISINSALPYLWSNLAVVFNRNDQVEDAKAAYLSALDLDPGNQVAANNLYLIYKAEGNVAAAEKLQARVERRQRSNPYYLFFLSVQAFEEGRIHDSGELLQKAIDMNDDDYRFHYELARTLVVEGDRPGAQESLNRAIALAPKNDWISQVSLDNLPRLED